MKYVLKYELESKYFGFIHILEKEFNTLPEIRKFINDNLSRIHNFKIYKLTDLSNK